MMPTTMAFSITNKPGVGIAMMTAAPKQANIGKNNHGNGDCSKIKKPTMMPKPTTTVEKNNSYVSRNNNYSSSKTTINRQQTASCNQQAPGGYVPGTSAGSMDDLQVL